MFFGEICDSIRGKIDCRQKIKPKSDRLLGRDISFHEQDLHVCPNYIVEPTGTRNISKAILDQMFPPIQGPIENSNLSKSVLAKQHYLRDHDRDLHIVGD